MKKLILLACLLLPIDLVTTKSLADSTYDTKGQVGFTGTWETSNSRDSKPEESGDSSKNGLPLTQAILPKTGEMEYSSVINSCTGLIILSVIAVYKKRSKEESL